MHRDDRAHAPLPCLVHHRHRRHARVQQHDMPRDMSGALHAGEAPNAHERPQPAELLLYSLAKAAQALHCLQEGHAILGVAAGRDDQQECVVGKRGQRHRGGRLLRHRAARLGGKLGTPRRGNCDGCRHNTVQFNMDKHTTRSKSI
eukprot:scaffold50340_cov63-Phaeocystis_antarctica.AAC.1